MNAVLDKETRATEMIFLDQTQAEAAELRLRGRPKKCDEPSIVLYYKSGTINYALASTAIARVLGDFKEALLNCTGLPWGDHWEDQNALWADFYRWRQRLGEHRRLFDAPGHQFKALEHCKLQQLLVWVFQLGWDAELVARPGRCCLHFSHDDRIEIYRINEKRRLVRDLLKLGFHEAGEKA
jgi:hypothetical protein